jgi:hypothetical protein
MLMAQSDLSVYHLLYGKFARRGLQNQMADKSERLTVLSDAEQFALYGLPDFDDRQRLTYLSLSGPELALASSRPGLHAPASTPRSGVRCKSATSRPSTLSSASAGTMHRRIVRSS